MNRQVHLVSRPNGFPEASNFQLVNKEIPELNPNELLVQVHYLSVDPYMRGRLGGRASSHPPFELNKPVIGDGVGCVIKSMHPQFHPGDFVTGYLEWANYTAVTGENLLKFDPKEVAPEHMLNVLGMTALTAYFGLLDIGQPKSGETVVVSAAAGAVGMVVGQIAKIKGCKVVGIAGSDSKVQYLLDELKFDAAINYKKENWKEVLKTTCSNGVDIYFDNVGGEITDEVVKLINRRARIVLCGQISTYNVAQSNNVPGFLRLLIVRNAMAKGFMITRDYVERYPEGRKQLKEWLLQGQIKPCQTIVEGLESIPEAFIGLFSGKNLGKQLVKVVG